MTDKQIIINGIDVSECNFTLERDGKIKCECTHATGFGVICDCESWKTCDYKNYKRKEQKLERITNMLFTGQCSNCEGYSPNCSNKELCNFKHNIKNIIDEVENEKS